VPEGKDLNDRTPDSKVEIIVDTREMEATDSSRTSVPGTCADTAL
jgi:hypothetical protein